MICSIYRVKKKSQNALNLTLPRDRDGLGVLVLFKAMIIKLHIYLRGFEKSFCNVMKIFYTHIAQIVLLWWIFK